MEFDFEKFGIALVGIVIVFLVATRLTPFLLGSAARMIGAGRGSVRTETAPEARPTPRPATVAAATGFSREAVDAAGGDWEEASKVNSLLARLEDRRRRHVGREGDLLRSQVAWKLAAFAQAALQRTLALAGTSTRLWNQRSVEGAVLCSRSVVESAAVLADVAQSLGRLGEAGDLAGLDVLVTRLGFGDALGGGTARPAVALSELIDACDRTAPGTRARYDILAGLAGPVALGQVRLAGDLDKSGTSVTFSDTAMFERGVLNQVAGGLQALAVVETALAGIDALLPRVLELDKG